MKGMVVIIVTLKKDCCLYSCFVNCNSHICIPIFENNKEEEYKGVFVKACNQRQASDMKSEYLYIKTNKNSVVSNKRVLIKDVVKVYSPDKKMVNEINHMELLNIKQEKSKLYIFNFKSYRKDF